MRQVAATRRVAIRRRWFAGTAAAMLLLMIGSILFLRDPMTVSETMITGRETTPAVEQSDLMQSTSSQSAVAEHQGMPGTTAAARKQFTSPAAKRGGQLLVNASSSAGMMARWMARQGVTTNRLPKGDLATLRTLSRLSWIESAARHANENEEVFTVVGSEDQLLATYNGYRPDEEPLIVGLSGKGGLSSFTQRVNSPMTLRSASAAPADDQFAEGGKNMLAATGSAVNLSEMEHDQPISFGLTLSKQITDNLYIESGLSYSYLSSRLRNANANFRVEETQKIHYLGIPVNLNYTLFTYNRFNLYASLGGMIEKDLYGEYRKLGVGESTDFNSSAEEEELTKISQRNPQFSVNAGLGLSYPVIQDLKIYGKVGGAYYFDASNQYKTIYSDRKIVMDLNIGLRYEF